ncbi:MAG: 23S rRNA (cytosine(1962)-C(5))-methyltransferase RlmI [Chloroflexi bacterium]|nr:MAG: 23S rRNA (cytosine(1962)-C(5))-methyltransferase RlmI [Chloroflexota bacterium]
MIQHHPWVFSGAIDRLPSDVVDGEVVDVYSPNSRWLARGYLNRASQIQVRLLTWDVNQPVDAAFWRRRLDEAIQRRRQLDMDAATNAYRLVNGENDYLPGLIVDRYADYLVLQAGTLGIDKRKQELAELLLELTGCRGVLERSDTAARRLEGLGEAHGLLAGEAPPDQVEIEEAGLHFVVDLAGGQKTGFYLDQRANRRRVAAYCAGARVLNGFSYTGAFAVHALAAGAAHVTNIDSSADVLQLAETNLRRNGFDPDQQTENIAGDIFHILRDWRDAHDHRFDVVILDPPKFAQNKQAVERALRGYKDINMLALGLLKPGGILATFSCSGLVGDDLFQKVIFGAAEDARRDAQILEWLHQDRDHPVALTFPEGEYLKGLICRVL